MFVIQFAPVWLNGPDSVRLFEIDGMVFHGVHAALVHVGDGDFEPRMMFSFSFPDDSCPDIQTGDVIEIQDVFGNVQVAHAAIEISRRRVPEDPSMVFCNVFLPNGEQECITQICRNLDAVQNGGWN